MNFIQSSYPSLNKRNTNFNGIFEKVDIAVKNFLTYLDSLYETNGIKYPMHSLYSVVVRIITPIQMLAHQYLLEEKSNSLNQKGKTNWKANEGEIKQFAKKKSQKLNQNCLKYSHPLQQKQQSKNSHDLITERLSRLNESKMKTDENYQDQLKEKVQQKSDLRPYYSKKILEKPKNKPRHQALTFEQQKILAQIIKEEIIKGNHFFKRQIINTVADMVKGRFKNFEGNGWYFGFMKRHPEIKALTSYKNRSANIAQWRQNKGRVQFIRPSIISKVKTQISGTSPENNSQQFSIFNIQNGILSQSESLDEQNFYSLSKNPHDDSP